MKRLPWIVFAVSAALSGAGLALTAQVPVEVLDSADNSILLSGLFVVILLVFGLVGAVVASRLPSNPIGWLFLALAALEGIFELAFGYAHYGLNADPGSLPGVVWAAWLANWVSPLSPAILIAALLLFPDGRPPTPRWRWVLWLSVPAVALVALRYAFAPGPVDEFPSVTNPIGVEGAAWLADVELEASYAVAFIAVTLALVVRFRRSHGVERQQVKWIALAAGSLATFLIAGGIATSVLGGGESIAAGFVFAVALCGVPIAAGLAILRHRLYDIDVVINRTLVYGGLTATLGATYLGLVLLIGLALGSRSDLAIAASTLAVAALFGPARGRIQAVVDRRFYRRRYDAGRTLEGFGARLRDQVDLEALSGDLRGVASETMQPAHVSLWLRAAATTTGEDRR